jgi:hypothetical protein
LDRCAWWYAPHGLFCVKVFKGLELGPDFAVYRGILAGGLDEEQGREEPALGHARSIQPVCFCFDPIFQVYESGGGKSANYFLSGKARRCWRFLFFASIQGLTSGFAGVFGGAWSEIVCGFVPIWDELEM